MHVRRRAGLLRKSFVGFEMEWDFLRGNVSVLEGGKWVCGGSLVERQARMKSDSETRMESREGDGIVGIVAGN